MFTQHKQDAAADGFQFVCVPLSHPRNRRHLGVAGAEGGARDDEAWTRSDMVLTSGHWANSVVGKLSPWVVHALCSPAEAETEGMRTNAAHVLWQEVRWAQHLSLPALLLPAPTSLHASAHYAHFVAEVAASAAQMALWLRVRVGTGGGDDEDDEDGDGEDDAWDVWNAVRTMCDHAPRLGVALELAPDLPDDDAELERWCAEPCRAVVLPTSLFLTNDAGAPVLSRRHQSLLRMLVRRVNPQLVLTGNTHHRPQQQEQQEEQERGYGLRPYVEYLEHVVAQCAPQSEQEEFEAPYFDALQVPLQPLGDNLESATYEVCEKDPVKYARYEDATREALLDWKAARASSSEQEETAVVMVVGAGRGPLVDRALAAAREAGVRVRVYAVEKNPNALVTLRARRQREAEWREVRVVEADMRAWAAPEQADVLVSELLGSFGDNELSPECLDGAQRLLKPRGVSIPCSYTSFVAPVSTTRLHRELRALPDAATRLQTPFVVRLHQCFVLGAAQPCFTFAHPNRASAIDNSRYASRSFVAPAATLVHGIAGYFHAVLYKDVCISTEPSTASPGMFSWFPLFFPLRQPLLVAKGERVTLHLWRQCSSTAVWYEWAAAAGATTTPVHNVNGSAASIQLRA